MLDSTAVSTCSDLFHNVNESEVFITASQAIYKKFVVLIAGNGSHIIPAAIRSNDPVPILITVTVITDSFPSLFIFLPSIADPAFDRIPKNMMAIPNR